MLILILKEKNDNTPLHCACEQGQLSIVQYLISKGANIEAKNTSGMTPLHDASSWSKIDVIKFLISKGANKNAKDNNGKKPYDLAYFDEAKQYLK